MDKINVALDGPAGAGKSTVARHVAKALGYIYVDTGSMYRAVTWKALHSGIRPEDTPAVIAAAERMQLELSPAETGQQVYVDGENVTELIRSQEVNQAVSIIAQIPEIRRLLADKQKKLAASKGVVMDGRDIGSSVLPDAEVKVFLTASPRIRAERRFKELEPCNIDLDELEKQICLRDEMDRNRTHSPLVQAEDAVLIDSSDMDLPEVIEAVLKLCRFKVSGGR
ncbi:(d)CMP kinase [Paenibacillus sp. J2TS4]|uniref:(d)CMP kinase n=1 Tax=Paenibacillus sp. J2TS4 TaxID=2807194 RepID=UPI001B156F82|nr:(d)CMP kinase [Paenibacillus sp. J2TS4]GIP32368.1 cytidylate kinase [Paenibacillus sp. J2TS4]